MFMRVSLHSLASTTFSANMKYVREVVIMTKVFSSCAFFGQVQSPFSPVRTLGGGDKENGKRWRREGEKEERNEGGREGCGKPPK